MRSEPVIAAGTRVIDAVTLNKIRDPFVWSFKNCPEPGR